MTERDWALELETYLQEKFADFCAATGQAVPPGGLRINPALGPDESRYFLMGLEEGLFRLDEQGSIESELFPASDFDNAPPTSRHLFSSVSPSSRLARQRISQLSTASLLIVKRGWLKGHVLLDPPPKVYRSMTDGTQLLVRSPKGDALICVTVKRNNPELAKLVIDFHQCCRRGEHAIAECGFPQNHPSYELCAFYKPDYFWAVAVDDEVCFRMMFQDARIELEQLGSLPPRSMVE